MAGDLIREVRRATLTHLKAQQGVVDLVKPSSIYQSTTPREPEWPFVRWDAPQSIPLDGACFAGATVTFLVHAFARDRYEGNQRVEFAEDHASRIGSALKAALHNRRVDVEDGSARLQVRSARLLRDGDEEGAYHAVLSVEARVLAS